MIGDLSPEFALATFFPARAQPTIAAVSDGFYAFANLCGAVTFIRRRLEGSSLPLEQDDLDTTLRRSDSEESLEERKALESIDEEIKTITKPSKPKQKVDKLALKALASFGMEASVKK